MISFKPHRTLPFMLGFSIISAVGVTTDAFAQNAGIDEFDELYNRYKEGALDDGSCRKIGDLALKYIADFERPWDDRWREVLMDAETMEWSGLNADDQFKAVAVQTLVRQYDLDTEWNPEWGARFECAAIVGNLGEDFIHQYLVQAVKPVYGIKPMEEVRVGRIWRLGVDLTAPRTSADPSAFLKTLRAPVVLTGGETQVLVNGEEYPIHMRVDFFRDPFAPLPQGWRWMFGIQDAGPSTIQTECEIALVYLNPDAPYPPPIKYVDEEDMIGQWSSSHELTIDVRPNDDAVVTLVDDQDQARLVMNLSRIMAEQRFGHRPTVQNDMAVHHIPHKFSLPTEEEESRWLEMRVNLHPMDVPLAYRVFATDGQREYEVGAAFVRRFDETAIPSGSYSLRWPRDSWIESAEEIDLIFRPDAELAKILGFERLLNNPFRIDDVVVGGVPPRHATMEEAWDLVRRTLEVEQPYVSLRDEYSHINVKITVGLTRGFFPMQGELRIGDDVHPLDRFFVGEMQVVGEYPNGYRQTSVYRQFDPSILGDPIGPITLTLRPDPSTGIDDELTFGPFDPNTNLRDARYGK